MIYGINALISRRWNVVRHSIAHASTVARFLRKVTHLSEYHVTFHQGETIHQNMPGADFLVLYDAGLIREAMTFKDYCAAFRQKETVGS
jgi:hypothetical protein